MKGPFSGGVVLPCALLVLLLAAACNPFAPELDTKQGAGKFGDPTTIDGYFQTFHYAYQFKDTTLYASLLSPEFIFSYRSYDRGLDIEWGRDEEVRTTGALFNSVERLDLLWGNVLDSSSSELSFDITRAFSLDIIVNPSDVLHTDGRAIFHLEREGPLAPWKAVRWRDESNL